MKRFVSYASFLFFSAMLFAGTAHAQPQIPGPTVGCGSIVYFSETGIDSMPISDCADPFGVAESPTYTPVVELNGVQVVAGEPALLPSDTLGSYRFDFSDSSVEQSDLHVRLFQQEGNRFEELTVDRSFRYRDVAFIAPLSEDEDYTLVFSANPTSTAWQSGEVTTIDFSIRLADPLPVDDCGGEYVTITAIPEGDVQSAIDFYGADAVSQDATGQYILTERESIPNCAFPFGSSLGIEFPYSLFLDEQPVASGSVVTLATSTGAGNLRIENAVSDDFDFQIVLWRKEGNDLISTGEFVPQSSEVITGLRPGEYFAIVIPVPLTNAASRRAAQRDVFTFTVAVPEEPEPAGASSVLFLPGIQASRLYQRLDNGQVFKVWEPGSNDNVRALELTPNGGSVNDIFTEDVLDEIFGVSNIYESFLEFLADKKDSEEIAEYRAFAYDWRFSVQDIVVSGTLYENEIQSVIAEIQSLAASSSSDQVSIVAHSNGGLLAKAAMTELERLGEEELIDKIIFIGTPHTGTPKALGTVLHGYDQQQLGGALVDDSVARDIINNMPGAYALLPSERYLAESPQPVISFREGVATEQMRSEFGDSITALDEYVRFLNGAEGRSNMFDDISLPYTVNTEMLDDALDLHRNTLDTWEPPQNVEVYSLVGVGLPTIDALEYRTVTETECSVGFFICEEISRVRPFAQFTQFGDETVAGISAAGVIGETFYFDLDSSNRRFSQTFSRKTHADLLELGEVLDFIHDSLSGTTSPIEFISETVPALERTYDIVAIDSPVDLLVTNAVGESTGIQSIDDELVGVREIPGSDFLIFGGTKYVLIPSGGDVTITLSGTDSGLYTLSVAKLNEDDEQLLISTLSDATTTPTMHAEFSRTDGEFSTLRTDLNGDGTFESETTLDGSVIDTEMPASFTTLKALITGFDLPRFRERFLLRTVDRVERFETRWQGHPWQERRMQMTWRWFSKMVTTYERRGWITHEQKDAIMDIASKLQ